MVQRNFFSSLYEIHQKATSFYMQNLNSDGGIQAKQYLLNRGINEAFLKSLKLDLLSQINLKDCITT